VASIGAAAWDRLVPAAEPAADGSLNIGSLRGVSQDE
jgi:hypothetical protein